MNNIEQQVFESIQSVIYPEYLNSAKLKFIENAGAYNSIIIETQNSIYRVGFDTKVLFVRIKTSGKIKYIAFPNSCKEYIENIFQYSCVKSDGFLRVDINEFLEKVNTKEVICKLNKIFINSFNFSSFGCCARYEECSKEGKCIHPDIIYASSACQYKKNLDAGKIFY